MGGGGGAYNRMISCVHVQGSGPCYDSGNKLTLGQTKGSRTKSKNKGFLQSPHLFYLAPTSPYSEE